MQTIRRFAVLLVFALSLCATTLAVSSTSGGSPPAASPSGAPLVINNPGQGSAGGVTCVNGNYQNEYPQYTGGPPAGKTRIRVVGADVRVTMDSNVRGETNGLSAGDTVTVANGCIHNVNGTGGTVNVGSGSSGTVTNTSLPGSPGSITINLVGGSSVQVMPGQYVPYNGG